MMRLEAVAHRPRWHAQWLFQNERRSIFCPRSIVAFRVPGGVVTVLLGWQ